MNQCHLPLATLLEFCDCLLPCYLRMRMHRGAGVTKVSPTPQTALGFVCLCFAPNILLNAHAWGRCWLREMEDVLRGTGDATHIYSRTSRSGREMARV
jgi:hypothetical protein